MIPFLPIYIVIIFILTTLITVGIFQYSIKRGSFNSRTANFLNFILPFWLIFQATLAFAGFYQITNTIPPRLLLFAVFPAICLIIWLFYFSSDFISKLPIKTLTLIHIIRIPIELVLFWLFLNGQVSQLMTFEGRNFDILTGITAPIIFWLGFRHGKINKTLLISWNVLGLILLINIVTHAILALPSPIQQIAFDQPNRAVLFFPFVWLPSTIVPIVLFSHLASLYQLIKQKT